AGRYLVATIKTASWQWMSSCCARRGAAGYRADAANRAANRDKQASVGSRAAIVDSHLPDSALKEFATVGNEVPSGTTVGRLVDTDTSFRVAGCVLFTGGGIQSIARRIARIHQQRANGVNTETAGDELPVLISTKRLISAPNTAARRSDVKNAPI